MSNMEIIENEAKRHHNELVISMMDLVRLVGFKKGDDDYYWIFYERKRGRHLSSCVGGFIPLRGTLQDKDYYALERLFVLNSTGTARVHDMECPNCKEKGLNYNPEQRVLVCPFGCGYVEYNCKIKLVEGEPQPNLPIGEKDE